MRRPCTRSEIYFEFAKVASEEQLARFEQYKRSKLPRAAMRRLMHDIVGTSTERCAIILVRPALCYPPPPPPPPGRPCSATAVAYRSCAPRPLPQSSLAKSYVGELVETARESMTAAGETGPLQPRHIRAAQRQAQRNGTVPHCPIHKRRMFWRTDCGA